MADQDPFARFAKKKTGQPALGTAPRRVSPGIWRTRKGATLAPAQAKVWEGYYRSGRTDGRGRMTRQSVVQTKSVGRVLPQTPEVRAGAPEPTKKPSFETVVRAKKGDKQALAEINRYQAVKESERATAARREELTLGQTGGVEQLAARANKTINPVAGAILEALSPSTAAEEAVGAVRRGDVPGAAVAGLGILPFPLGKGARAAKALKAEQAAAKTEGALSTEQKVLRSTGAARRTYAEQKKLQSAERGRRAGKLEPAFEKAGGGQKGYQAGLRQLKGELPKLRFDNLTDMDDATMNRLLTVVQKHSDLQPYEKVNLQTALLRVREGQVPRMFEIKLVERAFGPAKAAELASTRKKAWHAVSEVANLPRSIMASADVSAPFRQGLLAGAANPRIFTKNLGPMFRMLVSEKHYGRIMQEIEARPSFQTMVDAKLALTDLGDLSAREEQFMSNLAEKITGGKRGFVRASSRAYVGFLNRMRADLFDDLIDTARSQGIETPKLRRDVARFVNVATGRGGLGKTLEPAAIALNTALFSPRLFASRIAALNPYWYATLDPFARKQAVLAMAKLVGVGMTVLTLAKLAGAKVNTDPRNADFGKLRVGNTRFDIWGGHQQLVRLFAQIQQGEIVSSTSGKTLRLEGGRSLSRKDITYRFIEGKLAPTPGLIKEWASGVGFADKPFSWKRAVVDRSYPLLVGDMLDVYRDTGSPWKAAGAYGIGAFGVGAQTYGSKAKKKAEDDPLARFGGGGLDKGNGEDPFSRFSGGQLPKASDGDPFKRFSKP
jgi:hypothetical protein